MWLGRFFFPFIFVCVVVDLFPTKSAEIKQTFPQMPFFLSQLVVLFVVLLHLLELLLLPNKGMMKLCHWSIGDNSSEK